MKDNFNNILSFWSLQVHFWQRDGDSSQCLTFARDETVPEAFQNDWRGAAQIKGAKSELENY